MLPRVYPCKEVCPGNRRYRRNGRNHLSHHPLLAQLTQVGHDTHLDKILNYATGNTIKTYY